MICLAGYDEDGDLAENFPLQPLLLKAAGAITGFDMDRMESNYEIRAITREQADQIWHLILGGPHQDSAEASLEWFLEYLPNEETP